ncbi:MAG: iron-sulfur cluster assembly protein [Candidatus Hydrothermarchaeota archaeon]|nr:iron-sulfur cluster assembly protein [Candidatus Hydrothermarchaeota archaeon]
MSLEEKVVEKLKGIIDPHTAVSVYDMGLISGLKVVDNNVSLTFIPSSPFCPLGIQLAMAIKKGLKDIEEIKDVKINVKGHVQEKELNQMLEKQI